MIIFTRANIFETRACAIVNPINCVGAAGAGIALECRKRWPLNYQIYEALCQQKKLRPGCIGMTVVGTPFAPKSIIINMATKDHWKDPSRIEWICEGMRNMMVLLEQIPILPAIAIPALGCGNGKLPWHQVKHVIVETITISPFTNSTTFLIHEPNAAKSHVKIS